jgi:hypothetical protein
MPAAPKTRIPGFSQGVRTGTGVRTVKLVAPICPNSQRRRKSDGTFEEVGQNCQLAGHGWWTMCEEKGHDPYFSTTKRYETVDVTDAEGFVTGTKKKPIEEKRPNIVQVPVGRRYHSGQGAVNSIRNKGRKRLGEMGLEECCQFRNCQKDVNKRFVSPAFGSYCSREHLGLVAADQQGIFLTQVSGDAVTLLGGVEEKARQKRAAEMRQALAEAEVPLQ